MNRLITSLFVIAAYVVTPLAASADTDIVVEVPTDLSPGAEYRLAFVTSTKHAATSSFDIADYNAIVAGVATGVDDLNDLGTTWTAIASTATIDARDNTGTTSVGVPIYRLDGVRIADNNAGLWGAGTEDLLASLSIDESGLPTEHEGVWTGTNGIGMKVIMHNLGVYAPMSGSPVGLAANWVENANILRTEEFPLYAISGVLMVGTPEPSTLLLVCIGATAVVGCRPSRRRQRRR